MEGLSAAMLVDDGVERVNALVPVDSVFGENTCRFCNVVWLFRRGPTNAIASDLVAFDDIGTPMVVNGFYLWISKLVSCNW